MQFSVRSIICINNMLYIGPVIRIMEVNRQPFLCTLRELSSSKKSAITIHNRRSAELQYRG